jgi:formylglycine-generating enzyme required for sulfatase activity
VPKGLRSFDAHDAGFFLELLPGPRDEHGLPESVRFWKHRAEARNEPTFTVGVLYGPSGCGKSSLVKAGLLPRLAKHVLSVYLEATAGDTEARLLTGLRRRCPGLPGDLDLTAALAALRHGLGPGQKVFIVLDQFEQWLHAHRGEADTALARALRQCDGEHAQCVVLVRDDFWMGLTRFLQEVQIDIVPGQNTAVVDLFDPRHAQKVLTAFGRAFGTLAETPSAEQQAFLDQAVAGLAEDGRVISVRLAVFAEMVKGKPWTPATLKAVGGMAGVGVAFLEESFAAATAPLQHRLHQRAAQAVLKALLPETGTDIKGNRRSRLELLKASGYANRPRDFEELLRILDSEVRLLTPTDPAGGDPASGGCEPPEDATRSGAHADNQGVDTPRSPDQYYQLTHDYLVPSLRDWLTRKQRERWRGCAELRLGERAAAWTAKPESRHLPAWWEWLNIRLLTRTRDWTPSQRKMMRKARRYHALRGASLGLLLLAVTLSGWALWGQLEEANRASHAAGLVERLLDADTARVPGVIDEMDGYRPWVDPLLREAYEAAERDGRKAGSDAERVRQARRQLHASLGLLRVDPGPVEYVYGRLLDAEPHEIGVIRKEFSAYGQERLDQLWAVAERPPARHEGQRLRAACALAAYDPDSPRWAKAADPVVQQLVAVNPIVLEYWTNGFRDVKDKLLAPLTAVFRDRREDRSAERSVATSMLTDYAADQSDTLTDLAQDADEKQFPLLFPLLEPHRERVLAVLSTTLAKPLASQKAEADKEQLAKRQANAAVVLLRLGQGDAVWPLLRHRISPAGTDPRIRSYLIHRLSPLGADPRAIVTQLERETDVSVRRALLLCLGEFGRDWLSPREQQQLIPKVWEVYREDADAGLHGAAAWLLRQWGQWDQIKAFERECEEGRKGRHRQEERLVQIKQELAKASPGRPPGDDVKGRWYVNGQGQTLVVIPGPVSFQMGSPPTEAGREGGPEGTTERQHPKRISRTFAIAAKEVTVAQFLRLRQDHDYNKQYCPTTDCPANDVTWYEAAEYCNWLSKAEGIPETEWCYERNGKGEYADGMKLAPGYLGREGYRLPSEAEWEYACRAGARTSRYYGEAEDLLGRYAWYTRNSLDRGMLPGEPGKLGVAGDCLKPNDFGLFDMLGNALEWCQEYPTYYTSDIEDKEYNNRDVDKEKERLLRGGAFLDLPVDVRCALRYWDVPTLRDHSVGFRPARTFR